MQNLNDIKIISSGELLGYKAQLQQTLISSLETKFNELDAYIQNVDFLIDIEKVVDAVQPETDKVLKGL